MGFLICFELCYFTAIMYIFIFSVGLAMFISIEVVRLCDLHIKKNACFHFWWVLYIIDERSEAFRLTNCSTQTISTDCSSELWLMSHSLMTSCVCILKLSSTIQSGCLCVLWSTSLTCLFTFSGAFFVVAKLIRRLNLLGCFVYTCYLTPWLIWFSQWPYLCAFRGLISVVRGYEDWAE